jgi:YfiH family protein
MMNRDRRQAAHGDAGGSTGGPYHAASSGNSQGASPSAPGHPSILPLFPHAARLRCGISTRHGGVSAPPFDSLNLGAATRDRPQAVAENRRRFAAAAGIELERAVRMRQVHGARVVTVETPGRVGDADGLVTRQCDLPLLVTVADCMPVFFHDPETGLIAAVHAGWRGVVAGVLEAAVDALAGLGGPPRRLQVVIGPAIGPCCFEVGHEVAAAFDRRDHRPGRRGRPHVDLGAAARRRLAALGVPAAAVQGPTLCTRCHSDRFFSSRAGEPTGRMSGFLVQRPPTPAP